MTGESTNQMQINVQGSHRTLIMGNKLYRNESVGGTCGIFIQDDSDDNTIRGNIVYGCYYAYRVVGATCDNNLFEVNTLSNTAAKIADTGTGTKWRYNKGFTTENSGIQICANNENIAHSLDGIPTYVSVTPLNNTYDGLPVIANVDWSNIDSTNIPIGLYWVNGTAIADDIILVSWYAKYEP